MMKRIRALPFRDQQGSAGDESLSEMVTIGHVRAKIFWPVLLSSFLLLSGLLYMAFTGGMVLATELPNAYIIQADRLQIINGTLVLGVSASNHNIPVTIVTADEEIATNLRISKAACLPLIGKVLFIISAGAGKTPATIFGVRTDIQAITTNLARVHNDMTSTDARYGVRISASETLYGVTILAPFLSANSLTFPGAAVSVTRAGTC